MRLVGLTASPGNTDERIQTLEASIRGPVEVFGVQDFSRPDFNEVAVSEDQTQAFHACMTRIAKMNLGNDVVAKATNRPYEEFYFGDRARSSHLGNLQGEINRWDAVSDPRADKIRPEITYLLRLEAFGPDDAHPWSPRLAELYTILDKYPDTSHLIFVDRRATAEQLHKCLAHKYPERSPKKIVGHGGPAGMKYFGKDQQQEVLASFSNSCRLLVSTSVLEEGIDVADCASVILFSGLPTTVVSLIQAAGRARKKGGKACIISTRMERKWYEGLIEGMEAVRLLKERLMGRSSPKRDHSAAVATFLHDEPFTRRDELADQSKTFAVQFASSYVISDADVRKLLPPGIELKNDRLAQLVDPLGFKPPSPLPCRMIRVFSHSCESGCSFAYAKFCKSFTFKQLPAISERVATRPLFPKSRPGCGPEGDESELYDYSAGSFRHVATVEIALAVLASRGSYYKTDCRWVGSEVDLDVSSASSGHQKVVDTTLTDGMRRKRLSWRGLHEFAFFDTTSLSRNSGGNATFTFLQLAENFETSDKPSKEHELPFYNAVVMSLSVETPNATEALRSGLDMRRHLDVTLNEHGVFLFDTCLSDAGILPKPFSSIDEWSVFHQRSFLCRAPGALPSPPARAHAELAMQATLFPNLPTSAKVGSTYRDTSEVVRCECPEAAGDPCRPVPIVSVSPDTLPSALGTPEKSWISRQSNPVLHHAAGRVVHAVWAGPAGTCRFPATLALHAAFRYLCAGAARPRDGRPTAYYIEVAEDAARRFQDIVRTLTEQVLSGGDPRWPFTAAAMTECEVPRAADGIPLAVLAMLHARCPAPVKGVLEGWMRGAIDAEVNRLEALLTDEAARILECPMFEHLRFVQPRWAPLWRQALRHLHCRSIRAMAEDYTLPVPQSVTALITTHDDDALHAQLTLAQDSTLALPFDTPIPVLAVACDQQNPHAEVISVVVRSPGGPSVKVHTLALPRSAAFGAAGGPACAPSPKARLATHGYCMLVYDAISPAGAPGSGEGAPKLTPDCVPGHALPAVDGASAAVRGVFDRHAGLRAAAVSGAPAPPKAVSSSSPDLKMLAVLAAEFDSDARVVAAQRGFACADDALLCGCPPGAALRRDLLRLREHSLRKVDEAFGNGYRLQDQAAGGRTWVAWACGLVDKDASLVTGLTAAVADWTEASKREAAVGRKIADRLASYFANKREVTLSGWAAQLLGVAGGVFRVAVVVTPELKESHDFLLKYELDRKVPMLMLKDSKDQARLGPFDDVGGASRFARLRLVLKGDATASSDDARAQQQLANFPHEHAALRFLAEWYARLDGHDSDSFLDAVSSTLYPSSAPVADPLWNFESKIQSFYEAELEPAEDPPAEDALELYLADALSGIAAATAPELQQRAQHAERARWALLLTGDVEFAANAANDVGEPVVVAEIHTVGQGLWEKVDQCSPFYLHVLETVSGVSRVHFQLPTEVSAVGTRVQHARFYQLLSKMQADLESEEDDATE